MSLTTLSPAPAEPRTQWVDLTPELARELLDRHPRNRRMRPANLAQITRAIRLGQWNVNGEAIKLATDGTMLDGQHRCQAVLDTGITIRVLLITDLPPQTQDTMDMGKSRTLEDLLSIRGVTIASYVASLVRRLYAVEDLGNLRDALRASGRQVQYTNVELLAWYEAHPWVVDYAQAALRVANRADVSLSPTIVGVLMHEFDKLDDARDDADYFFDRLADGVNLSEDDPIYVLRRLLSSLRDNSRKMSWAYLAAVTIKAWNLYRDGAPCGVLRYQGGGVKPEQFPEPR